MCIKVTQSSACSAETQPQLLMWEINCPHMDMYNGELEITLPGMNPAWGAYDLVTVAALGL